MDGQVDGTEGWVDLLIEESLGQCGFADLIAMPGTTHSR